MMKNLLYTGSVVAVEALLLARGQVQLDLLLSVYALVLKYVTYNSVNSFREGVKKKTVFFRTLS